MLNCAAQVRMHDWKTVREPGTAWQAPHTHSHTFVWGSLVSVPRTKEEENVDHTAATDFSKLQHAHLSLPLQSTHELAHYCVPMLIVHMAVSHVPGAVVAALHGVSKHALRMVSQNCACLGMGQRTGKPATVCLKKPYCYVLVLKMAVWRSFRPSATHFVRCFFYWQV